MRRLSRRDILATVGSVAALTIAGCSSGTAKPRYRLSANTVPGSLAEHFRWKPRGRFAEADRKRMDVLVAEGALTTAGFALLGPDSKRYHEHDGSYYEISARRTGTVERHHWILWFDLIEGEPPADAEVFTSSLGTGGGTDLGAEYDLSKLDVRAVEAATGEVVREFEFHDPEEDPPGRRGHIFLRRGPEETALLPEPPFTHAAFETSDETRYARAVTERAPVELQQYEYTAEQVADSAAAYEDYVRDQHLRATFDRQSLPEDRREILDTITAGGGRYTERTPLSEAMKAILNRLGLADVETPEPGSTAFSEDAYFRYRGSYYRAQLEIFR